MKKLNPFMVSFPVLIWGTAYLFSPQPSNRALLLSWMAASVLCSVGAMYALKKYLEDKSIVTLVGYTIALFVAFNLVSGVIIRVVRAGTAGWDDMAVFLLAEIIFVASFLVRVFFVRMTEKKKPLIF